MKLHFSQYEVAFEVRKQKKDVDKVRRRNIRERKHEEHRTEYYFDGLNLKR